MDLPKNDVTKCDHAVLRRLLEVAGDLPKEVVAKILLDCNHNEEEAQARIASVLCDEAHLLWSGGSTDYYCDEQEEEQQDEQGGDEEEVSNGDADGFLANDDPSESGVVLPKNKDKVVAEAHASSDDSWDEVDYAADGIESGAVLVARGNLPSCEVQPGSAARQSAVAKFHVAGERNNRHRDPEAVGATTEEEEEGKFSYSDADSSSSSCGFRNVPDDDDGHADVLGHQQLWLGNGGILPGGSFLNTGIQLASLSASYQAMLGSAADGCSSSTAMNPDSASSSSTHQTVAVALGSVEFSVADLEFSDPDEQETTVFGDQRAYLDTVMGESAEARAERVRREAIDREIAMQMMLETMEEDFVSEDIQREMWKDPKDKTNAARNDYRSYHGPSSSHGFVAYKPSRDKPCYRSKKARAIAFGEGTVGMTTKVPATKGGYVPLKTSRVSVSAKAVKLKQSTVHLKLPSHLRVFRVENIVNYALVNRFQRYAAALQKEEGVVPSVEVGYHGSGGMSIDSILRTGFALDACGSGSRNAGLYGTGIYLSKNPNVALGYCRGGGKLLVCSVIRGKVWKCPGIEYGADLHAGYHSHESPSGQEWCLFNPKAVVPTHVIHFIYGSQDAKSLGYKPPMSIRERAKVTRLKNNTGTLEEENFRHKKLTKRGHRTKQKGR